MHERTPDQKNNFFRELTRNLQREGCIYRIKLASCTENFRQVAGENLPPRRKGPPVMGSASRSGWQSVGSVIVVGNRDAILGQNSLQQLSAFQVKV